LVLFSSLFGTKTAIYEPNIKFGKANKVLTIFVRAIFRGFPINKKEKNAKVIGIPLRKNIKKIDKGKARQILNFSSKPVIFCLGGSQGSHLLNCLFMRFVSELEGGYQIIHLTGRKDYHQVSDFYGKLKINNFVKDFYYNIEVLYSACDVIVSRAGANTLGEISFFNIPAVLIPHVGGGNHQKDNALYFQKKDAAFVCTKEKTLFEEFSRKLNILLKDCSVNRKMKANLSKMELGVEFKKFSSSIDY